MIRVRFLILLVCLVPGERLPADEIPLHWEYFEPEVDYTRRLRVAGASTIWEIVSEPTPKTSASSLKLTFQFSKQKRTAFLILDLPVLAFDRISFRVWNPNPPTAPIYLHLNAYQAKSLGALRESTSFTTRYYGDTSPAADARLFINPNTPSAPLPSSAGAGWISIEMKFPKDIVSMAINGKAHSCTAEDRAGWKNQALPNVSLVIETKSPGSLTEPLSLYFDDVEFYLAK